MGLLLAPAQGFKMIPAEELQQRFSTPRLLFLFFAAVVVVGAVSTVFSKNNVAAVMSLVATFFGLAAVYTFLSAHFLAALQVLVYAGAIMVLFIFVVMVLNRDETDPWVWRGFFGKLVLGVLPTGWLTIKLCGYLRQVAATRPGVPGEEFGTIAQVGELLFTEYLFAFEAVSVLLLIAVIAAVVVARTAKQHEEAHAPQPEPEHRFGDAHTGLHSSEAGHP
jgi:NADH-quinone oxidoreductase subunit J